MAATEKVVELYSIYTTNMRIYVSDWNDAFVCPICLRCFAKESLQSTDECQISEGHIFPESIGGKEITLECRECNNGLGSEVDSSLSGEFKWKEFSETGGSRKATITLTNGRRPVVVKQDNKGMVIQEDKKNPFPGARDYKSMTKLFAQPWSLTFNTRFNPSIIPLAVFHSAFLLLFRLFGYEYALSEGGKHVGQWLRKRKLPSGVNAACLTLSEDNVIDLSPALVGIACVCDAHCFAVCVPTYGNRKRRVVLLPAFERDDCESYMSVFDGTEKQLKLRVRQVGEHPPVCALADPQYKWFGHIMLEQGISENDPLCS